MASSGYLSDINGGYNSGEIPNGYEHAKKALKRGLGLKKILGKSRAIHELHEKIDRISSCDVTTLISGESGTGKELVARAIHYLSSRAGKPFIPVNCGAIPEHLFENELFGHVKGAFTDASFPQIGLVKEAEGGTLFLDEIGTVSPYIQIKFLRLLQDKEYKILGDSKSHNADIRIIAATNTDLRCLVRKGTFREDLFYRLNIASIHIPPLDERKEDIPILIAYFVKKYSMEYKKPINEVSSEVLNALVSYSWPGNVRELENMIQQVVVMTDSPTLTLKNIQLPTNEPPQDNSEFESFNKAKTKVINAFEKSYIIQLLTENKGDMVTAAKRSGKSRTGLWNLLKKHKLSPKQFR
ncbi:MAG: sigma-54 interaction domain-containing protein [bacterium]